MKKFFQVKNKLIFLAVCFALFSFISSAQADETSTVRLKIATFDQILFPDNNFTVHSCPDDESSTNYTLNAWCAVDQLISSQGWIASSTWYPLLGILLNSINQYDGLDGNYWLWFSNSELGATALSQHLLTDGENLLLVYGTGPLKINASSTTPAVNSTSTITVSYFDTSSWPWQWQPATNSTFVVNGQEALSSDGTLQLLIATTSPYSILGRKAGYLDSPILILSGVSQDSTPAPPSSPENIIIGSFGFSPDSNQVHQNINISDAINFLISNQKNDGSIASSVLCSDWAAIALSAYGDSEAKNKLKKYLIEAEYGTELGSKITDSERRAMALMALGVNPYDGTKINYISQIASAFDGSQIGNPETFNDDIFALFPLLKAGYSGFDSVIGATVRFIILKQSPNGSWGGVDLTAAAIQALSLTEKVGNLNSDLSNSISQSLQSAKNFLRNLQGANGGFDDNTFSTSWAIQAITALGESVSSWENSGKNPIDFLASHQKNDGGFENESIATNTRIWTTAYVIPAALNKTWGEILNSFPKQTQNSQNQNNATLTTPILDLPPATVKVPESKIEPGQTNNQTMTPVKPVDTTQQNKTDKENKSLNLNAQISSSIIPGNSTWDKTVRVIFYSSASVLVLLVLYLIALL
jgi:hypothetical protein